MSTSWPWRTAPINNYCSIIKQLSIGIFAPAIFQSPIQTFSGVDEAKLNLRKFRRTSTAIGWRGSRKVNEYKVAAAGVDSRKLSELTAAALCIRLCERAEVSGLGGYSPALTNFSR